MTSLRGKIPAGERGGSATPIHLGDKPPPQKALASQYAAKMHELILQNLHRSGAIFFFGLKPENGEDAKDELKARLAGGVRQVAELDFLDLINSDDVRGEIYSREGKIVIIKNVQTEAFEGHARRDVQRILTLIRGVTESGGHRSGIIMIAKSDVRLFVNFIENDALGNWCLLSNFSRFHETEQVEDFTYRLRTEPYEPGKNIPQ